MSRAVCVAVALSAWCGALPCIAGLATAQAQPSPVVISWRAPAGCPSEAEVQRGVLELLPQRANEPPASARAPVAINVEVVEPSAGGFFAKMRIVADKAPAARSFSGASCSSIAQAAILIAAIAVDAAFVGQRVATVMKRPAEADGYPLSPRVSIGARAAGDLGSLPQLSAGVGLLASLQVARVWFDAEVMAWLPRLALVGEGKGRGGEIGLWSAGMRTCFAALTHAEVAIGPCAGGELGLAQGTGINLSHPHSTRGLWAAAWLGLALRHSPAAHGMFVEVAVDALVALQRPAFAIDDVGVVFRSQRLIGRVALSTGWTFR